MQKKIWDFTLEIKKLMLEKNKKYFTKKNNIQLSNPFFFGKEKKFLLNCIKSGWLTTSGEYIFKFKKMISRIIQSERIVLVVNGTAAIQLAIRAFKPKAGDEIIVPSITFVSTINSISYNNCSPVFMDCDDDYLIDLQKTKQFLKEKTYKKNGFTYNKKTKKRILAIIVVHTFGNSVNLSKNVISLFKKHNIKVIEDAAESFGSFLKENGKLKHTGTIGDIGCFSFNGNKIFTSGGGGAVITKKKVHQKYIDYLSKQAKDDKINFIHNDVGYNLHISNLHSAIGCAQIVNLKKILIKKKLIYKTYLKQINSIPGLELLKENKNSSSNCWLNILKIDEKTYGKTKESLINHMLSKGIEVRSLWFPNHLQKPFLKHQNYKIEKSLSLFKKSICLPSSYSLSKKQIILIVKILKSYAKKY